MRKALRWGGIGLGALLGVALVVVVGLSIVGGARINRTYDVEPAPIPIPTDAVSIARGRYLAAGIAVCMNCHGVDMAGQVMVDDPALGYVRTPNLTPGRGGVGAAYSDLDWIRALRHGIAPNGKGLIFMPVDHYYYLSDEDLGSLIAYLKNLPPVDSEPGRTDMNFVSRALIGAGLFGELMRAAAIDHRAPRPPLPAEQGEYLAQIGGCTFCHGANLAGGQGPEPGAPPGPSLRQRGVLEAYTQDQFITLMRTGRTPSDRTINPLYMPWQGYRNMTDEDLLIIWEYLRSLPPAQSQGD
jgi:cytochrome c553